MDIASYVLAGQEQALQRRLAIVANNMANGTTVGFKREKPVFHDAVVDAGSDFLRAADETAFVLDFHAVHDQSQGAYQATGNPLDVMIDGPGYLSVEGADGTPAYTRAGFLTVDGEGFLAVANGGRLLGDSGQPIAVPEEERAALTITADGSVMGQAGPLGRIAITRFADENALVPAGGTLFRGEGGAPVPAAETRLRSGGVESSNVNPIQETAQMIDILRSYQASLRVADGMGDLRERAIDRLGRLG